MINIITSFYLVEEINEKTINRNIELKNTLKKNIESDFINSIYLYLDSDNLVSIINELNTSNKIKIINIGKQPLYSDLFKYANENLKGQICMITNSDIYIHQLDLECINKLEKNVYALSRYEHDLSDWMIEHYGGSHDAFIFNSPISIDYDIISHVQNVWGSENSVINMLVEKGINVLNPSFQIKIVHLHSSAFRNEDRIRIADAKYFIKPIIL